MRPILFTVLFTSTLFSQVRLSIANGDYKAPVLIDVKINNGENSTIALCLELAQYPKEPLPNRAIEHVEPTLLPVFVQKFEKVPLGEAARSL